MAIRKTYTCDLCLNTLDVEKDEGFRVYCLSTVHGIDLVSLSSHNASERIVCKKCCECISAQAAKYTRVRSR